MKFTQKEDFIGRILTAKLLCYKDRLKFTQKEDFIGRILTRASNEMKRIK